MIESLGDGLPKQQARVRALIELYRDPKLGGSGAFAIMMMEKSLQEADLAVMSGDVVAMIRAYDNLRGYHD